MPEITWRDVEHETQLLWERYVSLRLQDEQKPLEIEDWRRMNQIRNDYDKLAASVNVGGGMESIEERWAHSGHREPGA